jgi:hypothetical protein
MTALATRDALAKEQERHVGAYVSQWADGTGAAYTWRCPCTPRGEQPDRFERLTREEAVARIGRHVADALIASGVVELAERVTTG